MNKKEVYTGGVASGVTLLLFPQHVPVVVMVCLFMTIICGRKHQ